MLEGKNEIASHRDLNKKGEERDDHATSEKAALKCRSF